MSEVRFSTSQAAEQIGLSAPRLRGLVRDYEEVYGSLGEANQDKFWSEEDIARLKAARELFSSGTVKSIRAALIQLRDGTSRPVPVPTESERPSLETWKVALGEMLSPVLQQNEALQMENRQLQAQVTELLEALKQLPSSQQQQLHQVVTEATLPLKEQLANLSVALTEEQVTGAVQAATRDLQQQLLEMQESQRALQQELKSIQQTSKPSWLSRIFKR